MRFEWTEALLAFAFGGLLALERRAFLQAMLARPLVAATLTGVLLDDVPSGLFVGLVLELFHLGSVSLGAAIPEHDTLAATGTAAAAAAISHGVGGSSPAIWSVAILLFAGLGPLGQKLDRSLERYSGRLVRRALHSAEQGELTRAVRQNLYGMWPHFVVFGLLTSACYAAGVLLSVPVQLLPERAVRALTWTYPAIASVAAAIAVRGSHARRAHLYAGAAAALVTTGAALMAVMGAGR
jgi:mannose/fructose/N-acetylgalactosamine-specific phosphotransferase system component IIC